jgi:hypothetical protein
VGPRAGLDDVEKKKFLTLPRLELRPFDRPARRQSLYRLRYPGSPQNSVTGLIFIFFQIDLYFFRQVHELPSDG